MEPIDVFVELLDEGTDDWVSTKAVPLGDGLYKLLEPEGYKPELDHFAFLPGETVRLEYATLYDMAGLLATHPDPTAIRVFVDSAETHAPFNRQTHALPIGDGLYRLLPTPHYTPEQLWKFPPGSIVRVEKKKGAYNSEYLKVVEAR